MVTLLRAGAQPAFCMLKVALARPVCYIQGVPKTSYCGMEIASNRAKPQEGCTMSSLLTQVGINAEHDKALKIIAKSLFRELKENGYDPREIVSVSTELISLVTSDIRTGRRGAVAQ